MFIHTCSPMYCSVVLHRSRKPALVFVLVCFFVRSQSCMMHASLYLESPDFSKAILDLPEFVGTRVFFDRLSRSLRFEDARGVQGYGVGTDFLHFLKGLCKSVRNLCRCCGMVPCRTVNGRRCCCCEMVARLVRKGRRCRRRCHACRHGCVVLYYLVWWSGV